MIEESEALARILAAVDLLAPRDVDLCHALGCFVANDVRSVVAMPGFDNSAMDGYAVRSAEAQAGGKLRVSGEQAAGRDSGLKVESGACVRIFTGAPMPAGADAVVMQEDVDREGDFISVRIGVEPGEFVRRRGSDLCEGQLIFRAGEKLNPGGIGLLASQGLVRIAVGSSPRVVVVSTGDELVPPGVALGAGEIYNSNGPMLAALVKETCGVDAVCVHAGDEEGALRGVLSDALSGADAVIVSGGVSVGDHDLVKPVLASLGVETGFWKVRVKPGKPLLFGTQQGGARVFGLPGNPVSSFVTFQLFVRPALLRMMGAGDFTLPLPMVECRLAAAMKNRGDRPHYLRGKYDAVKCEFAASAMQQSHALFGLSRSDALLRMEAEQELEAGATVRVCLVV